MSYPTKLEELNKDRYGNPQVCSGCAHSTGGGKFPGSPSGERPCHFCERNVQREQFNKETEAHGFGIINQWYDGSPVKKIPMDCYISVDRLMMNVPEGSVVFG